MAVVGRGSHYASPHQNATYVPEYTRGLMGVDIQLDTLLTQVLCVTLGAVCLIVLFARVSQMGYSYLRRVTSATSSASQQRYWSIVESELWANVKKHLLYAPLGKKRHNREFKLSEAVNVGTLPSRFHTLLLSLYVLSQIAYCSILDYSVNNKAALVAEVRGRSGSLAVLNMIPLIILAGRNNPLIPLLHVSFDTYNLIHRWMGRIVVLESVMHTIAWLVNAVDAEGFSYAAKQLRSDPFFTCGLVGTVSMVFLILHSPSPIRHAFYETFLHLHQLGVFLAILGIYVHLDHDRLPQLPMIRSIIAIWIFERSCRLFRLAYLNISRRNRLTTVVVKALPGEASRVTFYLPRNVRVGAGSHVYAYLPKISLWMSHPFSVAWTDSGEDFTSPPTRTNSTASTTKKSTNTTIEKKDFAALEADRRRNKGEPTKVTLIMAARTGMTRKLYEKAMMSPNNTFQTTGFIEGPYSSHPSSFGSYGTVVLFSGGAGITHHMLHVRDLLRGALEGTVATRRIYLVWSVRTTEHLAWVRGFMDEILRMPNRRDILITKLFVSKPRSAREITSPSETLQMFPGRCRPDVVLDEVLPDRVGATGVSVCGPGAFADEVRASVRKWIGTGVVIDFVEEAFTW